MRNSKIIFIGLMLFSFLLSACSTFFQTDNTTKPSPLPKFHAEGQPKLVWAAKTGTGSDRQYLKLNPTQDANSLYTVSSRGLVTAVNKYNGQIYWKHKLNQIVTTGAGVGGDIVVIGTHTGNVIALNKTSGRFLWQRKLPGEILATPAVAEGKVAVKTMDGFLYTLNAASGELVWTYSQSEPSLVLRAASAPLIYQDKLLSGFANGTLTNLTLEDGGVLWQKQIATPKGGFTLERMIDIDADPLILNQKLYAVSYQGRLSSLDLLTGNLLWSKTLSSYTGLSADDDQVYLSDASGSVWALSDRDGRVKWHQTLLSARVLSPPACTKQHVVVADAEGFLHWIKKSDGQFAARISTGKAPIFARLLAEHNRIYAYASDGMLYAFEL